MSKNTSPTSDQAARFAEAARLAECDPDPAAFDAQLGALAAYKPPERTASKPRGKKADTAARGKSNR